MNELYQNYISFEGKMSVLNAVCLMRMLKCDDDELAVVIQRHKKTFTFRGVNQFAGIRRTADALLGSTIMQCDAETDTTGCNAYGTNDDRRTRITAYAGPDEEASAYIDKIIAGISDDDRAVFDKLDSFYVWMDYGDENIILTPNTDSFVDDDYFVPPMGIQAKPIDDARIDDEPRILVSL